MEKNNPTLFISTFKEKTLDVAFDAKFQEEILIHAVVWYHNNAGVTTYRDLLRPALGITGWVCWVLDAGAGNF